MQVTYRFKLYPSSEQSIRLSQWQSKILSLLNVCKTDRIDTYQDSFKCGSFCNLKSKVVATPLTCSVNKSASLGELLANEAIQKMSLAESDSPKLILEGGFDAKQRRSEFIRNLRKLVDLARNNFAQSHNELDAIREKYGFNRISQLERYWLYRCFRWILKEL